MKDPLKLCGAIHNSRLVHLIIDAGEGGNINDRAPAHSLPDTAPHIDALKPFRFGEEIQRLHAQSF